MRIVQRVLTTAAVLAALPASALADSYAGFGDPAAVAPATGARAVLAAAPLPGGRAVVLAATTGNQHVTAYDTGDPKHPHLLAPGWDGTVVTWPDGRRLAIVTAQDGIQTVAAGPDGTWGAPVRISPVRSNVSRVRAAALADGRAAIAWTTGTQGSPTSHLYAIVTDAQGHAPATPPVDLGAPSGFKLATAPDGTAAVAFQRAPTPEAPTAAASVAILPHGAAAFGAPVPVPVAPQGLPPIALAADGSAVLIAVSDTRIARIATSDGSAVPDLPPVAGSQFHPGPVALDVATDGTVALDTANPMDGWWLSGFLPDGTALPALQPTAGPQLDGDIALHAWPGGASVTFERGAVGDSSSPYAGVILRDPAGATTGTVLALGPELVGFPGGAPASFDAYTISGGTLWRISRPGAPARRPARLTTYPGQIRATQRVVGFHVVASQAGTVTVTARIRHGRHGRWYPVAPINGTATTIPFGDSYSTIPLADSGSVCKGNVPWTVAATVDFTNRAGVTASTKATYTRTCQRRHTTPAR